MNILKLKRLLIGKPLSNEQGSHELIPKWKALATLSSDALSSIAYATEEILLGLIAFGLLALNWSLPIAAGIILLMIIVTLSYMQIIDAYPNGGGAYIVAKENLGPLPGLIAGAALLIDYTLTVSVSVAAGVENLASAFPSLQEHMVLAGVLIIIVLMILSLRGISESATVFAIPCFFFIFSILSVIIVGFFKAGSMTTEPLQVALTENLPELSLLMILRAFSSGCSALTGIEAISNSVPIFRHPQARNAKITLGIMAVLLAVMFGGITYLAHAFQLAPSHGKTMVAQIAATVYGDGFMYYAIQIATATVLFLAASASYAGFPRLSSVLAIDKFAPRQLAMVGDKLVFSNGIIGLSFAAMLLLIIFNGRTHHLIPLYAVGVFLSFTLSQAGMVVRHLRIKGPNWKTSMAFNFVGMLVTMTVLIVIAISKFSQGAWMVIILIPAMVFSFRRIWAHYRDFAIELGTAKPTYNVLHEPIPNHVIVPISGFHQGVIDAIRYAQTINRDVRVCSVEINPTASKLLAETWNNVAPDIPLVILKSPYRSVMLPLIDFVDETLKKYPGEFVTVVVPEFVTAKWYHQFLHNQTAFWIRAALSSRKKVIVTSVRYHLETT